VVHLQSGVRLAAHEDSKALLGEIIKQMRRRSQNFKNMWQSYCGAHGGGLCDPDRHEGAFHVRFFEFMSHAASQLPGGTLTESAAAQGGKGGHQSISIQEPGQPLMKRLKSASGGMSPPMDAEKEALVMSIKYFQRQNPANQEMWSTFADVNLGGMKDPSRHSNEVLQNFIVQYAVEQIPVGQVDAYFNQGPVQNDPATEALVLRVKNFQRIAQENRDAWHAWCGMTKDPARHPAEKLMEFIIMHNIQ